MARRCVRQVRVERQVRVLHPVLLLLALLSCRHSPLLEPTSGPPETGLQSPLQHGRRPALLLVGATRAFFPFFTAFSQSSESSDSSALLATSSKDSATNVTSAGDSKGSSSSKDSSSGGNNSSSSSSSSKDSSSSSSSKDSSGSGSATSGGEKGNTSTTGDSKKSNSTAGGNSGDAGKSNNSSSSGSDTSSSGSDKSSSRNGTSSSGSGKSSSGNDTSSSGSGKSSGNDTSSSGSDKSSSGNDTSSSGSGKSSGNDTSSSSSDKPSSGSDTSSSGSDTSSNSTEPSTDSSGGGSGTGGGGQSVEDWRAPWAKGGVAEAETIHLVLTRGGPAKHAEPSSAAADTAAVAAGLPELPRVGLKNEVRYEYGGDRDTASLRTTMYTTAAVARTAAVSDEFKATLSRAEVTISAARPDAQSWYHTAVSMGSSQQSFNVLVDTTTDLLWVPCDCVQCADKSSSASRTSPSPPFNPAESSTLATIPCDSPTCTAWAADTSVSVGCTVAADLPAPDDTCQYSLVYSAPLQGSSSGNLVEDEVHLTLEDGSFLAPNLTFGCGRYQTGVLSSGSGAPDGVLGLGSGPLSPLSQLAERGVVRSAGFALCLEGDDSAAAAGGNHLLLGTTDAGPASGSTRLYKSELSPYLYVNVTDMRLGTADLTVTPAMFPPLASSGAGGTVLDSSASVSVLPQPAYMAFASAFLVQFPRMVYVSSDSAREGLDCLNANKYHKSSMSPSEFLQQFPPLTLVLEGSKGSTDFTISPTNYLKLARGSAHIICFTVKMAASQSERAVIAEAWMRDKYLVADTHTDTLSWIDANCTTGLAVITNTTTNSSTTTDTNSSTSPSPTSPAPASQPLPSPPPPSTNPPQESAAPSSSPPSITESPGPTAAPPPSPPHPSLPPLPRASHPHHHPTTLPLTTLLPTPLLPTTLLLTTLLLTPLPTTHRPTTPRPTPLLRLSPPR
ncbi:hypothetical protein CLOP_g15768 [Closterium sp. NIES-67]|nr:hypothetical protein CLOP_g15768 [Closterium sp. NIES-67]